MGFCENKYLPTRRGFDHFYGFLTGKTDYFEHTRSKGAEFKENLNQRLTINVFRSNRYDFRDDNEIDYAAAGDFVMEAAMVTWQV